MDLSHLLQLVSEIPQNTTLQYVRGTDQCKFVNVDIDGKRINSVAPNGEDKSWAPSYLEDLAPKIFENEPFNLSGLLNNKGSYRPVLETIIAHTREFYTVKKGTATALVWIPSNPKMHLKLEEIDAVHIPAPKPHTEYIKKINEIIFNPIIDKNYSDEELGSILSKLNSSISEGSKTAMFTLFGLKYGKHIDKATKILEAAGLPTNVHANSISTGKQLYGLISERQLNMAFWSPTLSILPNIEPSKKTKNQGYSQYITAMRTKPFLLLAGISGTGKSRIVRELARACWPLDAPQRKAHKPDNYEIIQVKPNWHDSSELIGYISRISGEPKYVPKPFIEFMVKAWDNPDIPHFLCLDEMNLAPVEQYFAEYLSVIETRKLTDHGIITDPLIKSQDQWFIDLVHELTRNLTNTESLLHKFLNDGIAIPQNLIVMGTVNMDETTFTFSRKVLDRAMTIEMNEVDLNGGLDRATEQNLVLESSQLIGDAAEGYDVYPDNKEVCDKVIAYLQDINERLEGTPFKIAYRARNEFLIYAVNSLRLSSDEDREAVLGRAIDEMTSMKILSRIEGDEQKINLSLFNNLREVVKNHIHFSDDEAMKKSPSLSKLNEMEKKLKETGFTSFWS